MTMTKKLLSVLLCLALLCAAAVPAFAAEPASDGLMTRAALVTRLHEAAGKPVVNYAMHYTDVSADANYVEAVRWAASEQLIIGFADGTFRPDQAVTREQMAVILYRCAQKNGQGFTGAWAFRLPYSDSAEIHEYAYEAVCWMTMNQIMGAPDGKAFAPDAAVTTADAAQILTQFAATMKQA